MGSILSRAERELGTKKYGCTWCVCTEERDTWFLDWGARQVRQGDGECCCWCENCEGYRTWYWAAGPGKKRLLREDPVVEPDTCQCIAVVPLRPGPGVFREGCRLSPVQL